MKAREAELHATQQSVEAKVGGLRTKLLNRINRLLPHQHSVVFEFQIQQQFFPLWRKLPFGAPTIRFLYSRKVPYSAEYGGVDNTGCHDDGGDESQENILG